jgi:ABC-type antimicrobial peptide transport system permease subunit
LFRVLPFCEVGLYATMAYAVARRTNEIGLRLALGAGRGAVIWMMLRDACVLAAVGLAAAILLTSALMARFVPAHRASRVDPLTALRPA